MPSHLNGKTITSDLRDQWHKERNTRIGASEIASACGVNNYDSQLRLWLTKTGKLPPKQANEAMEIGSALESAILELYQARTQKVITNTQVFYVSDQYDYLCATLDGITSDGINVQAKNVGCATMNQWGPDGTDEVPHHVLTQVNQEMLCSGLEYTHVVALLGGSELRIYNVPRNNKTIKHIVKLGREFMDRVDSKTYPEPDPERDQEIVKYLFDESGGAIVFDEVQSADTIKWERIGEELKLLERDHKQLKMALTLAMGSASQALLLDGRTLHRSVSHVAPSVIERKGYSAVSLRIREEK